LTSGERCIAGWPQYPFMKMPSWPLAATAFTRSCAALNSVLELRVQGERLSASLASLRIGLGNLQNVDPVERGQLIEVDDVVVQRVRNQNEIADVLGVERHLELQGVFHRAHAGHGMHRGAHAAEALGEEPGIAWIAAFENVLDTAPHGARSPCVADRIVVDFDIDAKVAFNSRDGVNRDSVCHDTCSLVGLSNRIQLVLLSPKNPKLKYLVQLM
jgi:hypothetical protein